MGCHKTNVNSHCNYGGWMDEFLSVGVALYTKNQKNIICSKNLVRVPKTPWQIVQREFTTFETSADTNMFVRQRGEPGQTPVSIPSLKQTNMICTKEKEKNTVNASSNDLS